MNIDSVKKIQVFINCSGKSGSKTLEKTLSKYYSCLHTHGNFYFQKHLIKSNSVNLYECIEESMKINHDVYVIDSYRTPLERAFSSSFQNNKNTTVDNFNYNLLIGENYSCLDETLYYFNIDTPEIFDFDKKMFYVKHKNLHIIKLRLSDINDWDTILSNIFNREIIIESENLSKNKGYYNNYKYFLENITVPKKYFDNLINSKDFMIYNNEEENNNYIEKWSDRITDTPVHIKNLPEDFDWKEYVRINKGRLQQMTELEVCIHYAETGRFEGKKYKDEEN